MTYGVPASSKAGAVTAKPLSSQKPLPATGFDYYAGLSEDQIQKAVFEHLERRGAKSRNGSSIIAFHPKNGGLHQSHPGQRVNNAKLGVIPGIPDVLLYKDGQLYCLELKSLKGKLSAEQQAIGHMFRSQGAITGLAFGLTEALAWLERHNLLIGKTI